LETEVNGVGGYAGKQFHDNFFLRHANYVSKRHVKNQTGSRKLCKLRHRTIRASQRVNCLEFIMDIILNSQSCTLLSLSTITNFS